MSYIGTNAGLIGVRWYYNRLIDKGDAPLLDPEAALNAPELPKNHPYFDFKSKLLMGLSVFGLIAGFGIIPALFYFAQREYFSYLQPLIFDNTLSSVLTIFPAIFLSCGLFGLLSLWLNSVNKTFAMYSAYGLIINANKYVQGLTLEKIPFERLITKEHVKKVQKHQHENSKKWLFWMFIITLPFFYMLWNSYSYATTSEISTVLVNSKTSYAYKDAKQIDISFIFKEEKNDDEYELEPHIYAWVTFENGSRYNLCEFNCSENKKEILTIIEEIQQQSKAKVVVIPLRTFEADILQKSHPRIFETYTEFLKLIN